MIRWALVAAGVDEYALFTGDRTARRCARAVTEPGTLPIPATNPETCSLFYTMNIPAQTSIDEVFDNTAGVRSYSAFTNLQFDTSPPFIPRDNIDPAFEADANAEPAIDDSSVLVPGARVTKTGDTSVQETNNDDPVVTPIQAVPGETVTYTYAVEIPGDTSVFDGVLSDSPLPADIVLFGAALGGADPVARYYPDASDTSTSLPLPGSFAPNALAADGTLTFPAVYSNDESTTARFEVELTTRVRPGFTGQVVRTNTARFVATGGGRLRATRSTSRYVSRDRRC